MIIYPPIIRSYDALKNNSASEVPVLDMDECKSAT